MSGGNKTSVKARFLIAAAIAASFNKVYAQPQAFLSVDINGGYIGSATAAGQNATNLGWGSFGGDTSFQQHPVNGVNWTPWSGPGPNTIQQNGFSNNQGGDDIQLPMSGGGAPANVGGFPNASITKTFTGLATVASGQITATISSPGGATNNPLNARDRGTGGGSTNFADLYRDFVFVTKNTGNQLGGSPLQLTLSGLNKNTTYTLTTFAYDNNASAQYVFSEINSLPYDYAPATEQVEGSGQFANPQNNLDGALIGPRVSAPAGGLAAATDPYQFSSTFQITSDNTGNATVYEWSNTGPTSGLQAATVLNGFQVGTVASSTWSANGGSTTWDAGFAGNVPNADKAVANFGSVAAAQTVSVDPAGRTVGVINIASPTAYTLSGGTLTFQDTFPANPNLPPPNGSAPSLVSDTTGHSQINVLGDSTFSVTHIISAPVVLMQQTSINTAQSTINLKMTGNISGGSRGLNKLGSGILTLTGNNTYGGETNVYAGQLIVDGHHTGGGDYLLAGGATLGGTATISLRDDIVQPGSGTQGTAQNGKVQAWNGSAISPGDGGVGTLTLDRLAMGSPTPHGSGSIALNIDIGSATADRLNVTDSGNGTFTDGLFFANGSGTLSVNVSALAGATTGVFPILDYSGAVYDMNAASISALSRVSLASTSVGGFTLALIDDTANTSVDLQVAVAGPSSWQGGGANNNWGTAANWTGIIPNGIDATANFGTVASGSYSVNVEGGKTLGSMTFSGANSYTLSGSTITFQSAGGAPQIVVSSGNHTIGTPIQLNNFLFINVQGTSTLNITGQVVATASGRQISTSGAGTVQFAALNMNVGGGAGTLNVTAGTAKIAAGATSNSAASTSTMSGLTLAGLAPGGWTSRFDLTNNSLILDYPVAGPSPIAAIQDQLKQGYAGGAWNGNGIVSSSAAGITGNHKTAIAYAEASSLFTTFPAALVNGTAVPDNTAVILEYTLAGDADMSGSVNISDFNQVAANFGGSGKVWMQGDFNYDGVVNVLDLNAIATNFGSSTPSPAPVALGALVPEPTTLGALAGLALLLPRRRRSH